MALAAFAEPRHVEAPPARIAHPRDCWVKVFRDNDAIDALEGEWNALADRCADPRIGFQSFAWLRSWVLRYAEAGREVRLLLGYYRDRLAMVWPIGARVQHGLTIFEGLGEPLSQYHDILLDDGAPGELLIDAALDHLRELPHDLLWLRRVREDSPLNFVLRRAGAKICRAERAPYVELGAARGADLFDIALSGKARQNRRRRMRRLEEMGEITQAIADTPALADEWIATALEFKRQWSLNSGIYAPAIFDPRFELCFRDAARSTDPRASLRVFALLCGDRPIGIDISLAYRDRLFAHVLSHDPGFAKFGVGAALADASIRHASEQGYQVYDLLAPADPYKSEWTHAHVGVNDFWLPATRAGAWLGAARLGLDTALRHAARRAPLGARRALISWAERRRLDTEKPAR